MNSHSSVLRDFTVDRRVWLLSAVAVAIGAGAAVLAVVLLKAIAFATNLFYYHRLSLAPVSPAGSPLGIWMVLVPIVGGVIVGLMARFGSDKIRGHGIPEAIAAILLNGARVDPIIAVLKPISAAISIGSGGPFGAEGPIIMTGGELLLFEWRPRSLVPVAFASITAEIVRTLWLGSGPLFAMPNMAYRQSAPVAVGALALGLVVGVAAAGLSRMMYGFEDLFERLPVHWMWWPAIGGIGIGVGGLIFPRGLGVGYDNIAELLRGNAPLGLLVGLVLVKSLMWAFSLGSGTSGGVLAPLLMIGGAMGELAAHAAHASAPDQALWAAVGMGAMLSGSLGVPLTAIVFCLEVTHCLPALLPVMLGCVAAYAMTSLIMPRSILTEKLSRRGTHLTREYGTDPLETVSLVEVMAELGQTKCTGQVPESPLPEVYAFADETSRAAVDKMAISGLMSLLVIDRDTKTICGTVRLRDLLLGRRKQVKREQERERVFTAGR